jgi:hypothetical protein
MFPRSASADVIALLLANLNSFVCDYSARQKVGGTHLKYHVLRQLPVLPPAAYSVAAPWSAAERIHSWILPRVLELTYTAWDIASFARECGYVRPPFHWDEERRFLLRCELDAAFFHLYLPSDERGDWFSPENEVAEDVAMLRGRFPVPRDAVAYIMDSFPIVRRKDEERHGRFLTKDTILEIYDAMAASIQTSKPYETRLDPPPADLRCCHPQGNELSSSVDSMGPGA